MLRREPSTSLTDMEGSRLSITWCRRSTTDTIHDVDRRSSFGIQQVVRVSSGTGVPNRGPDGSYVPSARSHGPPDRQLNYGHTILSSPKIVNVGVLWLRE